MPENSSVKTLPPIKSLFTESWELLKKVLVPIIIFNVIAIAASVLAIVMMVVGFLLIGFGAGISGILNENPLSWGFGALAVFLIFFIVLAVISSIAQIGSVIIFYEGNPKIRIFDVVKRSTRYILPLIGAGILIFLIVFGGLFLFLIPGIVFSIFLSLAYYAVIVENKGPLAALRRSMYLVKSNFSGFFIRVLALWGVVFLVNVVLSLILSSVAESTGEDTASLVISLINLVLQFLTTWFSVAYTTLLFKQLQKTAGQGEASLKIISVLAVIGWVIAVLLGYVIFNAIGQLIEAQKSGALEQNLTPEEREELEKLFREIDGELNTDDLEQYMEDVEEIPSSTSAPQETI